MGPLMRLPELRFPAAVLVLASLALVACTAQPDPVVELARQVPTTVVGDDGLLLRRGADGSEQLVAELGIDPTEVRATAAVGVPALRLLLVPTDAVAEGLHESGFDVVSEPSGWVVLRRGAAMSGFAGAPAVAVGEDVVAVGGEDQLAQLVAGGRPLPLPQTALEDATIALVRGPVPATGEIPAVDAAVVAARSTGEGSDGEGSDGEGSDGEGPGVIALRLSAPGEQAAAVALSVRLRTETPVTADGLPVVTTAGALTDGDVVTVELTWLVDPAAVLTGGVSASPLAVLDG